jgi:hypothetical protein
VTVMRTVETHVSHTGHATLVSDVRSFRLGVSGSCARVRERVVHAGVLPGAGCAHRSGTVGRHVCCRRSSWQEAVVQRPCGDGMQTRCKVLVFKCQILANYSNGVVQVRNTDWRFKLCARIAPSCTHRRASMRIEETGLTIPGCRENVQHICRLLNYRSVMVARTCVTLRRCTSDGCADRPHFSR